MYIVGYGKMALRFAHKLRELQRKDSGTHVLHKVTNKLVFFQTDAYTIYNITVKLLLLFFFLQKS